MAQHRWARLRRTLGTALVSILLAQVTLARAAASGDSGQPETTSSAPSNEGDVRSLAALGLGGAYVAFGAWTWLAWYRERPRQKHWTLGGDGGFGVDTYAGGADKLGHAWTSLVLTRLGGDLLEWGGFEQENASWIATGFCLFTLLLVEVNDGYFTEFSPGDLGADALGAAMALGMRRWPAFDRAVDFRVQWFPSTAFRRNPGANIAEDYAGQAYLLAFKPQAIGAIREAQGLLAGLQFVNPVIGFAALDYQVDVSSAEPAHPQQSVFLGLTLDVQVAIDRALQGQASAAAHTGRGIGHTFFEYVNLPFSTARVVRASRFKAPASVP